MGLVEYSADETDKVAHSVDMLRKSFVEAMKYFN